MAHIMIIGAFPESLLNFRGNLIQEILAKGHRVTAVSGPARKETVARIEALGASFVSYPVFRNSRNPFHDFSTFRALRNLIRAEMPNAVLAYTIKPVVYAGLASSAISSVRFVALITGLGYAFQGESLGRKILTHFVTLLYKRALRRAYKVIFQNSENRKDFVSRGIVDEARSFVVSGSGVDMKHFRRSPISRGPMTFLLIARLLKAKGIREYAEAARLVKKRYPDVIFHLVGPPDPSPDAIALSEIHAWHAEGILEYMGEAEDVRPYLAACHVYVLPSYHEGMPRTVLEAMAIGRSIITTDVPGCRETVIHGVNGQLVPPGDSESLFAAMVLAIKEPALIETQGEESYALARQKFDVQLVNSDISAALL